MNIRSFLLLLLGVLIIIFNYIYGNAISGFLSVCITGSIIYYLFQMFFERNILNQVRNANGNPVAMQKAGRLTKRYRAMFNFLLMTALFVSAVICIRNVAMPREDKPYFYNNEYHAISNSSITFSNDLPLYKQDDVMEGGKIVLQNAGKNVTLQSQNYYKPIFVEGKEPGRYQLVNKIYNKKIKNEFGFSNGGTSVKIQIAEKSQWLKKLMGKAGASIYTVSISSNESELFGDQGGTVNETFTFSGPALKKGMSLYNLMFEQEIIQAPSPATMQVLQHLMQEFGNSYLLAANEDESGGYYYFPTKSFIDNGYKLTIENQTVPAAVSNKASIAKDQFFYIGFNNSKEKMMVTSVADSKTASLIFDHPSKYWLSVPQENQVLNHKALAFLTNDFDQVIDGKSKEGFYFHNFGLITDATFEGRLNYIISKPTDPLQVHIQDLKATANATASSSIFTLTSSDPTVQFDFEIKDYSENGFSFSKMLLYAGVVYIAMLMVLIFFPGKDIGRIEAIIFTVIYGLFIVRMIMYWRLATFPPLENISKHELNNTILNFDFNFFVELPIPLTVIWLFLFLGILVVFRVYGEQLKGFFNKITNNFILTNKRSVVQSYGLLMLGILIFNIINNKVLGIEILIRILSIIVPLILYLIFSIISNNHFELNQKWVDTKDRKFIREIKAYFYYFVNNPAFAISMITLAYFAIADRGFAVLFVLFLILKSILLSFLKKSYNSEQSKFWQMIWRPNNFWFYGIVALILYFVVLSVKSLFYYALLYYMWLIGIVLGLVLLFVYFFYKDKKRLLQGTAITFILYLIVVAIPFTRHSMDHFITEEIKHVQYRISILNQPISDLLMQNEYSSFSTRKIIETAENQWFINSYISKEYDSDRTINLRPYNRIGVNYNTQTRDVVLARFVIGEMGNTTMYLILTLCVFPLLIYLISFKFTDDDGQYFKINRHTYPGVIPLILFFTICLFVWLTSTNRFVFFGQDYPFLSLTSKTSMILPLLLLGITLVQRPKAKSSEKVNIQSGFARYVLFIGLVVFFALITVTPHTLTSKNFSVIVDNTQRKIDQELNAILTTVQDSISVSNPKFTYLDMIAALKVSPEFESFLDNEIEDPYTKSIVEEFVNKPYKAFQVHSPLYVQYDDYRYAAMYNQHFYLELTPVENEEVWHGSIAQAPMANNAAVTLTYDNVSTDINVPSFKSDNANNLQIALLPQSWLADESGNIAIIDVNKSNANPTSLSIFKDVKNIFDQRSTSFATTIYSNDLVAVTQVGKRFTLQFEDRSNQYAINKWINGKYRILYPQRPKNMWIHHFARSIKAIYNEQDAYRGRYNISLDFVLNKKVEQMLQQKLAPYLKDKKFKYSVIAADGDGHIHLMQDFVSNRKIIDPNDDYTVYSLKQQQFFFSNIRNERDQWGEANLLNMMLGPGSSIKPLIAGVVTSQVNAGWEHLVLNGVAGDQSHYAGFKMVKPWIKEVQDGGSFDLPSYISKSSNFYQSLFLFLGSYPKESFVKDGKASLANVLTSNARANNSFPSMNFNGANMYFSNYNKGNNNWPRTNYQEEKKKFYFGNENSLIANGMELNANLITKEKNKDNQYAGAYDRVNIIDSASYVLLQKLGSANYLWSMPEESSFLQSLRSPHEIHQNVNIGLKTATLGGYPYQLSAFKMLEMYGSLLTQNRAYRLHLDSRKVKYEPWHVDETWGGNAVYNQFLSANIFKGMSDVISAGTARSLNRPDANYYYYAKTGTINEQGSAVKSSKRLIVAISNKDLTVADNVGKTKVYLLYFMSDRTGSVDYALVNQIVAEAMKSSGFKNYFNN